MTVTAHDISVDPQLAGNPPSIYYGARCACGWQSGPFGVSSAAKTAQSLHALWTSLIGGPREWRGYAEWTGGGAHGQEDYRHVALLLEDDVFVLDDLLEDTRAWRTARRFARADLARRKVRVIDPPLYVEIHHYSRDSSDLLFAIDERTGLCVFEIGAVDDEFVSKIEPIGYHPQWLAFGGGS